MVSTKEGVGQPLPRKMLNCKLHAGIVITEKTEAEDVLSSRKGEGVRKPPNDCTARTGP